MAKQVGVQVQTLAPVELGNRHVRYAGGVRVGRWVFATGHMATDYTHGIAAGVENLRLPYFGQPRNEREATVIFEHLRTVLHEAGAQLEHVVRLDQYYTTWKAVDPYHVVRRAQFGSYIPPSTSVLQRGLLLPQAEIEVEALALLPDDRYEVRAERPADVSVPPTSGFAPVVQAGDFIFVAGQMATDAQGLAAEAQLSSGQIWGGTKIKKETEYIISKRLQPALHAGGSSLANVVKAQVYLQDLSDIPAFNEVWAAHFPTDPPATTIVPTHGFGNPDGTIEINVIAVADHGNTPREVIHSDVFTGYDNNSVAIRAGDLLFISGLMATDENGLIPSATVDPAQPYFASTVEAQMEYILTCAERICSAAGTSLDNVVRIQQFHTDLRDFYPAYCAWQRRLPDHYLPFSAVQVPDPLPVPGCSVILDLWVYAP